MSARRQSARFEEPAGKDRIFAAGDGVELAKLARAEARKELVRAEEAFRRAEEAV